MGRFDEANSEMKTALDMEPFDANMGGNYAWALLVAGQNDKALEMAKKTYDLEPNHPITQYYTTMVYNANGMYSDALGICENELKSDPKNQRMLEQAGIAYARTGRRDKAEEVVKKFEEIGKTQFATPYRLAAVHVALGNRDEAFASLEKSYQVRDWWLIRLKIDSIWAPLRDDARYNDLLKRLGLPL